MNNIQFLRQNGGVPKSLPGQDHYSGLVVYIKNDDLPTADAGVVGFSDTNRIIGISTIEGAEALGIKADATVWSVKVLHYHLSECFRINPAIVLWVGLFDPAVESYDFMEIKKLQNYAEGNLRQVGVYVPMNVLSKDDLTTLQGIATNLESVDTPVSIIYSPKIANITDLTGTFSVTGQKNVSVVIGQAGSGLGAALFSSADNSAGDAVGLIGNILGTISKASVQQSIGWVANFPSGVSTPALVDGVLMKELDKSVIETLDNKQFIFLRTYTGLGGSYYNDSWTMDSPTSDYPKIENVRVMDKAVRGIRAYLLPELGSNVLIDAETGKLTAMTVAHLTNVAGKQLEDMEKAGELSGYAVDIDPNQNVLSTSTIEIVIKQVGVGVMRNVRVKIGFTNKL